VTEAVPAQVLVAEPGDNLVPVAGIAQHLSGAEGAVRAGRARPGRAVTAQLGSGGEGWARTSPSPPFCG
jgi:hypothetical protein